MTGGVRRGKDGLFIEPTIFKQTPNTSRIVQEEVFGPVVTVHTFKTEEEAVSLRLRSRLGDAHADMPMQIEMANDTVFGLSGKIQQSLALSHVHSNKSSMRVYRVDQSRASRHSSD